MQATGGRGVDVVLEMAAHINLDKDLSVLARNGRVVVIGNRGRVEIDPRGTMGTDAAILGMTLFNVPPPEIAAMHAAIVAGLATERSIPSSAASCRWRTRRGARGRDGAGRLGKIVLVV